MGTSVGEKGSSPVPSGGGLGHALHTLFHGSLYLFHGWETEAGMLMKADAQD